MSTELQTIKGKQILLLDLEEPAAICAARAFTVAATNLDPQLREQLQQITNARVGKEQK